MTTDALFDRPAQYWHRITHTDPRALDMADRHYARQSIGTPAFIGSGHKIALMHFAPNGSPAARWASHRPAPGKAVRTDGRDAWACTMFRIEQRTVLASDLILEAVAITRSLWSPLPADGLYTTINPDKVAPIKRRGVETWGYCYLKAGWILQPERTKARQRIILMLPAVALAAVTPIRADVSMPPFGSVWRRWSTKKDDDQMVLL